jgi:NADH-quinone oxidoreductase subunit A
MLMEYASVGAFFAIAIGFVFAAMVAGWFVRPHHLYDKKLETYECGEEPVGQAWFNFNPRFYIIALIYIVFDIEIAFLYPVATVFKRWVSQGSGWFALIEMLVFIAILLVGLGYVWAKGDLDWIRNIKATDRKGPQNVVSTSKPAEGEASLKQATAAQEH